jgi:hypothetical protein
MVLVYPSIPLVPLTTLFKLPLALLLYLLCYVKRFLTGQRLVLVIADLPLEQALDLGIPLAVSPRIYRIFESLLFRTVTYVVSPSRFIDQHISVMFSVSHKRMLRYRLAVRPRLAGAVPGRFWKDGPPDTGLRLFYAGDLRRSQDADNFCKIARIVAEYPEASLVACGTGGEFIRRLNLSNVTYAGVLDTETHDRLASSCDVGLILYPTWTYYCWVSTSKYSAYLANGLAVLSTKLDTVEENIRKDGIGLVLEWVDLEKTIRRWIESPHLVRRYKRAAERLSGTIRTSQFVDEWFDTVVKGSV